MNLRGACYDGLTVLGVMLQRQPLCGPRIVQVSICDECNLACAMCNRLAMGAGGMMPAATLTRLVSELYPLGMREIFFHGFGEPCLHPQLPEVIQHTRTQAPQAVQHIITNGACMPDPLLRAIRDADVKVRVSAHAGDRATWKAVHPDDDDRVFDRIAENVRRLADGRPDRVEILFVLTNLNCDGVAAMLDLAGATGVRHLLFRPMRLFPDAQGRDMNRHLMLTRGQYERLQAELRSATDRLRGRIDIQAVPFLENRFDDALDRPSSCGYYRHNSCYIGSVLTVIASNGDVWGCVEESSGGVPLGNVHRAAFRDIWWGEPYRAFRERQLFRDKHAMSADGCHSFCQHLGINRKLNNARRFRLRALRDNFDNR
jgi:MoaA/NifB/PqqE/SkfB family radical SAM enzyme